ncbi:hypothetical protein G7054_g842 [Neopestalotiopsis clavispora]|nr:hypothetical protein G7054_g842 [Neopestalotiopsis clavispora]
MLPSKANRSSRTSGDTSPTFIQVRGPSDSSWRKTVRSQAASARHSAARRRRLLDHQQQQQQQQATTAGNFAANEVACILQNPESLCGIRGVDPFDSLGRSTTRTECFLMKHSHATILIEADAETLNHTGMRIGWVQLSITDGELLNSLFLSTCRNLLELGVTGDYYERALTYRARYEIWRLFCGPTTLRCGESHGPDAVGFPDVGGKGAIKSSWAMGQISHKAHTCLEG